MNTKYTVEIDDEFHMFYVVEWEDYIGVTRIGETVEKYFMREAAVADCEILNRGYEYEMSAICASEFDA